MNIDLGLSAAAVGLGVSVLLYIVMRRVQTGSARADGLMREEWHAQQLLNAARMECLESHIESLEVSTKEASEILQEDRLNHSTRSRALQLLRSGISPDSAAASLGMPRQELRLLGKVSRLLSAYR